MKNLTIRKIDTQGITYITKLDNSDWYFGQDYAHGDLYEAEELFNGKNAVTCNKMIFVHYPDGRVVTLPTEDGQYWGIPVYYDSHIYTLKADFKKRTVEIIQYDNNFENADKIAEISLLKIRDCYNLMLGTEPLMLTRQSSDNEFQIIWPEKVGFQIGTRESFIFRSGNKLYFQEWHEDPEYREEIVVRDIRTGEVLERTPGTLMEMPDGQVWVLE